MGELSNIVQEVVGELLEENDYDRPRRLNRGDCPTVAARILEEAPDGAERYTGITVFDGTHRRYPAHTWVEYDGLCYDAECISGTPHWHNLPIFRRGRPIDPDDVKPKYRTEQLKNTL